jgi:hypothetical protein
MIFEDQVDDEKEKEPVSQSSDQALATQTEPDTALGGDIETDTAQSINRVLNFFRGSVTPDRLHHENAAQHGGLAHWRQNTSKQRSYDDQILHAGMGQPANYNSHAQAVTAAYGASTQSPGMGLEAENLQSFITGSHLKVVLPIAPAPKAQQESGLQQEVGSTGGPGKSATAVTNTDNPLLAAASGQIYNYRRKKSVTFTNLLARAESARNE